MFILITIFLLHFFIGQFLELTRSKLLYAFFSCVLMALVVYFTWGIRDAADMEMYTFFYENEWNKVDPMFLWIKGIMRYYHYDYFAFYRFHMIVSAVTYFVFISRYTKNIFYVFLIFFVLYYVPFVNQIRYYFGFPFFLMSLHFLIYKRNLWLFGLFTALAITSHSAIIVLYSFLPLYYFIKGKNFFKVILIISASVFTLVLILFQMGVIQALEHFGNYAGKGMTSSFSGGVFNALPYFIYLSYLWLMNLSYRKKHPDFEEDKLYGYLSKLTFYTVIFIPASFFIQIFGNRYVFPFVVIWIIFFLFMIKDQRPQKKFFSFLVLAIVNIVAGYCIYILPKMLFGESSFEDELQKSLKSIPYLEYLFS